ncbi:hypothetical protein NDU88_002192 [Pleurodeles waltl]|uniref:Uncharacterized protein n=1 Tax=Pleurodeles waltl TaxID=8319 RepID=A0AAV7UW97_PLEWA|nr:hypothetical protein NDU88_002192 [Pleurodeles waltl]
MVREPGPAAAHAVRCTAHNVSRAPKMSIRPDPASAAACSRFAAYPSSPGIPITRPIRLATLRLRPQPHLGSGAQPQRPLWGRACAPRDPQPTSTTTRPAGLTILNRPGPVGHPVRRGTHLPAPIQEPQGNRPRESRGLRSDLTADQSLHKKTLAPSRRRAAAATPSASPGCPVQAGKCATARPRPHSPMRPRPSATVTGVRSSVASAESPLQRPRHCCLHSAAQPGNHKNNRPDRITVRKRP